MRQPITTVKHKSDIRSAMASLRAYTAPCRRSSTRLPSARNCIITWNFFSKIWMNGCSTTKLSNHTPAGTATVRAQWITSGYLYLQLMKNWSIKILKAHKYETSNPRLTDQIQPLHLISTNIIYQYLKYEKACNATDYQLFLLFLFSLALTQIYYSSTKL